MNNNRNNNRRRGRGNNRQQGGGQQLNRIDSRARGNAPQLLEKYKKLAHDAHLNGDRVQAEYYLQFADHYFRVIADTRLRQDEQRARRDDRFEAGGGYEEGDDGEFGGENEIASFDQPYRRDESPREPRREEGNRDGGREGGREAGARDEQRRERRPREDRPPPRERFEEPQSQAPASANEGETESTFEPAGGNPFTRGNRVVRGGLRPRRDRDAPAGAEGEAGSTEDAVDDNGALDPAALPPAIAEGREQVLGEAEANAPAPRRRGRPRKSAPDEGGETLEAVSG